MIKDASSSPMLLAHHPDRPERKRAIGYWRPIHQQGDLISSFLDLFITPLPDPRAFLDLTWDMQKREAVAAYLRAGDVAERWLGCSDCRLCGVENGSKCLTDGWYIWPEGFPHYLTAHAVRPPADFVRHCLRKTL